MNVPPLLFILLSILCVSLHAEEYLKSDNEIFEDALLEHLHDIGEDDFDFGKYMNDDDSQDEEPKYARRELISILQEIKREKRNHHDVEEKNDKETIPTSKHNQLESDVGSNSAMKSSSRKRDNNIVGKKKTWNNNYIKIIDTGTTKRGAKNDNTINDQEAVIVLDDSIDKQNQMDMEINLRDVLPSAVTNKPINDQTKIRNSPSSSSTTKKTTTPNNKPNGLDKVSFIAVIAGCSVAVVAGFSLAAYCWYKLRSENQSDEIEAQKAMAKKLSSKKKPLDKEKPLSDDEKMVQNAEMYHYQHAKNQMQQLGQAKGTVGNLQTGDTTDEDEDEDTVYECPGLAAPGDMKVVNPLFSDGDSPHQSDKQSETTSHGGTPTPPNERIRTLEGNEEEEEKQA